MLFWIFYYYYFLNIGQPWNKSVQEALVWRSCQYKILRGQKGTEVFYWYDQCITWNGKNKHEWLPLEKTFYSKWSIDVMAATVWCLKKKRNAAYNKVFCFTTEILYLFNWMQICRLGKSSNASAVIPRLEFILALMYILCKWN